MPDDCDAIGIGGALSTGWEPDVPVDDSLARRFVFAYADRIAAMAAHAGGRVADAGGARMADLGSPFGYDNAVVLIRPPESSAALGGIVGRARAFFPPERWWVLLSLFATGDLTALGLVRVGHPPSMLRPAAPLPARPPELEIRVVEDAAGLGDFCRVLVEGYGLAEIGVPAIADLRLARSLLRLVVGYVDGAPVCTAGSAVGHGIVEVDWVATLPAVRGRGYGGAITAAVLSPATMWEHRWPTSRRC